MSDQQQAEMLHIIIRKHWGVIIKYHCQYHRDKKIRVQLVGLARPTDKGSWALLRLNKGSGEDDADAATAHESTELSELK